MKNAQVNLSYGSAAKMKADSARIVRAASAGPVWIGRNGYGSSSYAMLNVERWDITNERPYIARLEVSNLPASWAKILNDILPYTPQT